MIEVMLVKQIRILYILHLFRLYLMRQRFHQRLLLLLIDHHILNLFLRSHLSGARGSGRLKLLILI